MYITSTLNPTMEAYKALHQTTGWNAKGLYTYDQLYRAICNSWFSLSIYNGEQLIGYGRIISDGIYQTFICDVMVHPDYQRKGFGTMVMEGLLEHCQKENIKWIQLFCAKGKQPFYQRLGFCEREADAPGMMLFYEGGSNS
ncbi:GNAT family N-acetyltransferase [Lysinibacillus macroides]|uniref:GNAT family acetyltransferase n=1 Tax=Lysinibacillus macroides TaxID=33935 RepID=A0A0M9DIN5_9BACI|nr:GNAT family N-acetyltransferase [Lysinibacillus macroides]KOY80972.1 GNAT family acetyltransferase [Lysinibacillus macroides]QPR68886.1 GNAT family N-acetyltransferase [Lysinibacillus macroides]